MFFSCVCRFVPCFALCSALSIAGLAHAHSVYIYAWPEHGGICTESYYSTEDKVRAGKVEMMTAAGESLQIVQSDQEGRVNSNCKCTGEFLVKNLGGSLVV